MARCCLPCCGSLGLRLIDRIASDTRHLDALRRRARWAALLGASLWMLHPLFVSTTLYIVQREAMLPATFELIGLLLWLRGRRLILSGRHKRGIAWMLAGLGGGTLLALLSKADGALLPLFALVIEWTLLRRPVVGRIKEQGDGSACLPAVNLSSRKQAAPSLALLEPPYELRYVPAGRAGTLRALRPRDEDIGDERSVAVPGSRISRRVYAWTLGILAGIPTLALLAFLAARYGPALIHGTSVGRPWTIGQRLLTEPRVLLDYLRLLWIPRPFTSGLFNDQFAASTSAMVTGHHAAGDSWHNGADCTGHWRAQALPGRGTRHPVLFRRAVAGIEHHSAGAVFRAPQLHPRHADVLAAGVVVVRGAAEDSKDDSPIYPNRSW